jgi:hypothetical protein
VFEQDLHHPTVAVQRRSHQRRRAVTVDQLGADAADKQALDFADGSAVHG